MAWLDCETEGKINSQWQLLKDCRPDIKRILDAEEETISGRDLLLVHSLIFHALVRMAIEDEEAIELEKLFDKRGG